MRDDHRPKQQQLARDMKTHHKAAAGAPGSRGCIRRSFRTIDDGGGWPIWRRRRRRRRRLRSWWCRWPLLRRRASWCNCNLILSWWKNNESWRCWKQQVVETKKFLPLGSFYDVLWLSTRERCWCMPEGWCYTDSDLECTDGTWLTRVGTRHRIPEVVLIVYTDSFSK